jgi:hypothetical protein
MMHLSMDKCGKAIFGVPFNVLPDVEYRTAGSINERASELIVFGQFVNGHPEGRNNDYNFRSKWLSRFVRVA